MEGDNAPAKYAEEWDRSSKYLYDEGFYSWMANNLIGVRTVLEIGCGSGYSTLSLIQKGYKVIAIDKNEYCIDKAKELLARNGYKDEVLFLHGDITNVDCVKGITEEYEYDFVVCWNIGTYWTMEMMSMYLPKMVEYGLTLSQIRSNPESSYAELMVWWVCKLAKISGEGIQIVERVEDPRNVNLNEYYNSVKQEFGFSSLAYNYTLGSTLSGGGKILKTNEKTKYETVIRLYFLSILFR